ncbi:scabin-related ADP-ribosyltransferase [Pseudomonas gingeri]|uniref:scabin-related ADP-ribosyltransferase n=1 Tax=Pseudomonas gingeri TaxID=117681 RepID=UPI003F755F3C
MATSTDLYNYALQNEPSIFVSASKSPTVARDFADKPGGGYVYTIRGQSQGLDVNAILGRRSPFPQEFEIAVPSGVRPQDIMGARQVGPTGTFIGPFIKNPAYGEAKP